MIRNEQLREVVDLTDSSSSVVFNMSIEDARDCVASGDPERVKRIDGHFALVGQKDHLVRMARSLSSPIRYFIAKRTDGPALIVSDRIDAIRGWLAGAGLADQFHPSYTRMVPAHYITEVALVGCPDPSPSYTRFFTPRRNKLSNDRDDIGKAYIGAVANEIQKWLRKIDRDQPIGVLFSGGIDSGAVFLLTYHALLSNGMNPARIKAFTLSVDGRGEDLQQARRFLEALDLQIMHEPIEVPSSAIDMRETISVVEDYKPLDVQAGAMTLALCKEIRRRYPEWKYLIHGDGGDENLKDYPIEENPELTIRSVLNNPLLYHEGWGVDAIKHSLTYSGGLSRGCTRTYAPASQAGFSCFGPYMSPNVIRVSESIPFVELSNWQHDRLYELKGDIVSRGVKAFTGHTMPVFEKRRFQEGAGRPDSLKKLLPDDDRAYRQVFHDIFAA